jgi:hypothetical protein
VPPTAAGVFTCFGCRAVRKKRRGGDDSDETPGTVPPEENQGQIIQYTPNNNGDFSDSLLRHLTDMMPAGNMPADFTAAFDSLQLNQVCRRLTIWTQYQHIIGQSTSS